MIFTLVGIEAVKDNIHRYCTCHNMIGKWSFKTYFNIIMKAPKCITLGTLIHTLSYIIRTKYYSYHVAYADKCISVRGSLAKTHRSEGSCSLLPTLRGIIGSALPTVSLLSNFRKFYPRKSEQRFTPVAADAAR